MYEDPKNPVLIITGSFNGLMDRIARSDYWSLWMEGRTFLKKDRKDRIEATMPMSKMLTLTGLTHEDIEFLMALHLITVVEQALDPLLSAIDIFTLARVFERFIDDGVIKG